ncbi:zinc ribbon domain-containing protein [Paenibacillus periandrae]|uniref:zinc ribbon domain-containing protein n=1 Tax=Paenibacillus periandrae TaxID=1761741 RepID=UPI001F099671|nr:zinc ribbon domain-containing protein [Paenibacillus periandrae]
METNMIKACQSCAAPLGETNEMHGTNADGSTNPDYCKYCFADGEFTADTTMDEMIEFCVPYMVTANAGMTENEAKAQMKVLFPTLKRWAPVQ